MKKTSVKTIIPMLLLVFLTACSSTVELSPEEQSSLIQGTVFNTAEPVKIEYQPYEVIKYVYPEEQKIVVPNIQPASSGELVETNLEENTVKVESASDFVNGIVQYNFLDGRIYDVFTTPGHVTDIRLSPGETISGKAAIGDSESWQIDTAVSSENGRSVTHIYVKPVTIGIETSMIVPTDQRTYYINLKSFESMHMVGVRWNYPGAMTFGSDIAAANSGGSETEISIRPDALHTKYKISGTNTIWRPTAVFDDGVHTYFQFDPRFNYSAGAPALYLLPSPLSSEKNIEIINYVVKGNMYIADFVLQDKQTWLLMSDKAKVKITRK